MLAHEGEALGVVHQARDVGQVRCGHDGEVSSREAGRLALIIRSGIRPPRHPGPKAATPEPDKSHRGYFGPAGQQLRTDPERKLSHLLGTVNYPVGVIAGDRALDLLGWLLLPRPNDGRVSVDRTHVGGMAAHVTVHATHALMVRNAEVIRHTIQFLRYGKFDAGKKPVGDSLLADPALPNGPSAPCREGAADH